MADQSIESPGLFLAADDAGPATGTAGQAAEEGSS
jgi:hypothetical protein